MSPVVSVAQIRPRKADYAANLQVIAGAMRQAVNQDPRTDILVFPETATSGYFLEGGVSDVAVTGGQLLADLAATHASIGAPVLDVVIGFYEEFQGHYHNSAMYATLGGESSEVCHIHRKVFLPTYGVFDESRFIQPGDDVGGFDTRFGRAAMIVCEDAWHSVMATLAALDGASMLFIPSASPARGMTPAHLVSLDPNEPAVPSSIEQWERLARTIAGEHGIYVVMAQLVGFEGGKGFPGVSVIVGPDGTPLARAPLFDEAIISAQCDPDAITRARTAMPLLSDLRTRMPRLIENLQQNGSRPPVLFDENAQRSTVGIAAPTTPLEVKEGAASRDPLRIDAELASRWLEAFINEEVVTRRGFERGIVGLSGGVDSALTAFLAARALGAENVIGVRMPYATSSQDSLDHAKLAADACGIELLTVDITAAVDGYASALDSPPGPARLGNVMARTRMITLFDLSAARRALPLGTGNKTERLLGYFTWHADDSPPVNPLGDLFKTQVWELARYVGVPEEIISKPATADLIEGQTDEGDLGVSYPEADVILHLLLTGHTPGQIEQLGCTASAVQIVNGRLSATHWKRRLPTVAMVSQTAIGEFYLRPVDY